MYTEQIVTRNQLSWLQFPWPFWGIVGLVSAMNTLQVHPLRPFRFTPVIYHVSFSTAVGTARIAQLVLWLGSGLDDWEILFWFMVGARDVSVVHRIQTECWVLPSFLCSGYKGLFPWGKVMGHETDPSPRSMLCSTFVWDFWLSIAVCIVIRQSPHSCSQYKYIGCSVTFEI